MTSKIFILLAILSPVFSYAARFSSVSPLVETEEVSTPGDAADDLAVWVDHTNPANSLILGTDKHFGLEIYNLKGKKLAQIKTGPINNIDLRQDVWIHGSRYNLVVASNKTRKSLDLYHLDPNTLSLKLLSRSVIKQSPMSKAYGVCLGMNQNKELFALISIKKDKFYQYKIVNRGASIKLQYVRPIAVTGTSEGCVVDEHYGVAYIAEEERGLWSVDLTTGEMKLVQEVGLNNLNEDLEGIALYRQKNGEGLIVLSSQGNHSYAIFDRKNPERYLTSFRVGGSSSIDPVSDTDGIEIVNAPLGPNFPEGIFIVQDGENTDRRGYIRNQNFKLISFEEVLGIIPPLLE